MGRKHTTGHLRGWIQPSPGPDKLEYIPYEPAGHAQPPDIQQNQTTLENLCWAHLETYLLFEIILFF